MSGSQLMIAANEPEKKEEEEVPSVALLDLYESEDAKQLSKQDTLKEFYTSLQFPCCGQYMEPKLAPIVEKKKEKGKPFTEGQQIYESKKLAPYDGLFEHNQIQKEVSTDIVRLKSRLVRDSREEYFQENGYFIVQKQLFQEQLSRLANISFDQNYAIRTYQKNAILSERNNQKKSTPYELEINIGCIWINRHQLQNQEEKKFQELRPLLRQLNLISAYPILPELSKQLQYLLDLKEEMLQREASQKQIDEIINKIQITQNMQNKEIDRVHKIMESALRVWKEIKNIRIASGRETVPWRINVKEYNVGESRKSYDIGVTPIEINERLTGDGAQAELQRREQIKKQKYFIRIYINGYEVAKSEKVNLQWPTFKVNFNQKFNITVYSSPSSIQVEIFKSGVINQSIDTISLALPGIHSKTITSSQQRFAGASFALNGSKFRKRQEEANPPSGMIIYRIEWKGQGSRMPPVSFKSQQEQTAATQESEQEINYNEIYDIKDPRTHKIRQEEGGVEIFQSQAALLPFIDIQSARHLLLKLKAVQPQFEGLEIPILEEQIRKRQDLLNLLQNQRIRNLQGIQGNQDEIFNPAEGIFSTQDNNILDEIRQTLSQIQNIKINAHRIGGKYKITEQIIDEYIFEQMQSPIVIFCRNLFTQKRKLGPQITYYQQPVNNIEKIDINLHVRSARNMPIREEAFLKITKFQEEEKAKMDPRGMHHMLAQNVNMNMYSNYGAGFYQGQQGMNFQGNNFFIPGMMNMGGVRPNMEATYQKKNLQRNSTCVRLVFKKQRPIITNCFEGPFPEWNETLLLEYSLKASGMNIEKLYANNEKHLKVLVFDITEESKPTTVIAEKRIKQTEYYLGRIDIPMSMLVAIPSLSGLFKLERPLILFGYGIKRAGLYDFDNQDAEQSTKTEFPDIHTLINLDLFTDPLIDNMTAYNSDRKFVAGSENTLFLQRCSDWLEQLNTKRYIRLWLNNIEGKSIFICKYLSSEICPPPLGPDNLIERCARFVGMIPKKFSCKLLQNTEQFHMTCHQFLNVKMGEDHGILLCNYFNNIDKSAGREYFKSYLAIGKAFPYGKAIFVVRRDTRNNNVEVWDPYQGQCVYVPAKQYDTICCFFKYAKKKEGDTQKQFSNMIELGCLVSETNVYINMQEVMKPEDLDFNLQDDKLWKPFLNERMQEDMKKEIKPIQNEINSDFYPRPQGIESEIQTKLNDYIRKQLQSDRKKHFKPYTLRINPNVSSAVRNKILLECETFKNDFRLSGAESDLYNEVSSEQKSRFGRALAKLEDAKNQVKGLVDGDKLLYGYTLNMPFTCLKDIWQKVQDTQIHLQETQNMQFVLAIRCFELACHIVSVWVFVGSIS